MENQLEHDRMTYSVCRISHQPSFKIKYDIGYGKTQIELICTKCIQDPAYVDGILSMWCYDCKREHDIRSLDRDHSLTS